MKSFFLCFVPMFVAVDPIGLLPIFMGLTHEIDPPSVRRIIRQSVVTAAGVALAFVALGTAVLKLLGITVADFMVAGGVLLFVISMSDLIRMDRKEQFVEPGSLGAVPLGVPLITGPAVLTVSILLLNEYGFWPTAAAIVVNVLLAGVAFRAAVPINRILGKTGAKIVSKISSLLLAAIAVMIVRKGLTLFIDQGWFR